MKFYYEGKLIRTSKNHIYTHAVISADTGCVIGCRSSKEACEAIITNRINARLQAIENEQNILKAMQNGQNKYSCKDGRKTFYMPIDKDWTEETIRQFMQNESDAIEYFRTNYKVVELEAK